MSSSSSSEAVDKPPTLGLVAGKYELVRVIGRGGMGSVWEARHVTLGTRVAIKFVDVDEAESDEARARFQNEARAAATIQSRHAIKVYDHGILEEGRPYIVMELLLGEPLDRRLETLHRLPLAETARIVQQVARALQQAHDAGITHRDLKPENIFLEQTSDDEEETAKVLDFGIAKIRDPARALALSSTTKTGVLMGTPFFMSPEQVRALKTVDHRSDLWSLGVIVFRCVTGALPFQGESLGDLLVKICAAPIPTPSSVMPGLSPQLDAWMQRALDREPEVRFQSAVDMANALAVIAGISVRLPSRRDGTALPVADSRRGGAVGGRLGRAPRRCLGDTSPAPRGRRPRRAPRAHSRRDIVPPDDERAGAPCAERASRHGCARRNGGRVRARGRGRDLVVHVQEHARHGHRTYRRCTRASCSQCRAASGSRCAARPATVRVVHDSAVRGRGLPDGERDRAHGHRDLTTSTEPCRASCSTHRGERPCRLSPRSRPPRALRRRDRPPVRSLRSPQEPTPDTERDIHLGSPDVAGYSIVRSRADAPLDPGLAARRARPLLRVACLGPIPRERRRP